MSGFFGCVSRKECVADVFYGTDYHSHLGTKKAGMAFYNGEDFVRSIHSIESAYFRNKFEPELGRFIGSYLGIGVISDMESQPITVTSHLGVTEALKASDPMKWVGLMNTLKAQAEETILTELVFS